jgi:hypothetical protein
VQAKTTEEESPKPVEEKTAEEKEKDKEEKELENVDTFFGLNENKTVVSCFEDMKKFGDKNYNNSAKKEDRKDGMIHEKVLPFNKDSVNIEFLSSLQTYYKLLCRSTIQSFLTLSKDDTSDENNEVFLDGLLPFLKIYGNDLIHMRINSKNEKPYEQFKQILEAFVSFASKNEKYHDFVTTLFKDELLNSAVKGIRTALDKGADKISTYFTKEEIALDFMNPYMMIDLLEILKVKAP